jgi:glycerol-3-phosphate acyltransferase PlsY
VRWWRCSIHEKLFACFAGSPFYPAGWQLLVITLMRLVGHIFSIFLGFKVAK